MHEYGITFASVIFIALIAIVGILFFWLGISIVRRSAREAVEAHKSGKPIPEGTIVLSIIKLLVLVALFISITVVGWTAMQSYFATTSDYENPVQKKQLKDLESQVPPSDQELDKAKQNLLERRDAQQHEKAIESFDEKMKREAEKIRQRNQAEKKESGD